MVNEVAGDIFLLNKNVTIVHYVSTDKNLNDAFSLKIKQKYPDIIKRFASSDFIVGECYGYTDSATKKNIIQIAIINKTIEIPTYTDFEKGMYKLKELLISHKIHWVAIPKIDYGLDWDRLYYIIAGIFFNTPIEVGLFIDM